jgi:predicted nucleotidyltransferase
MSEARGTKRRSRKEISATLASVVEGLVAIYGNDLVKVILYGSFAKGRATEDSDIDIAVILRDGVKSREKEKKTAEFTSDVCLEHGELVSVIHLHERDLENTVWPLYWYIKNRGIVLWNK